MKKSICVLALIAVIALVASLAIAAPGDGGGGIVGTKHDLSSTGGAAAWGDLTETGRAETESVSTAMHRTTP